MTIRNGLKPIVNDPDEFEKVMLEEALVMTRGNQTRAAEVLGLNRGTLRKKVSYLSS
jgi:DNA-binding protein Fis